MTEGAETKSPLEIKLEEIEKELSILRRETTRLKKQIEKMEDLQEQERRDREYKEELEWQRKQDDGL